MTYGSSLNFGKGFSKALRQVFAAWPKVPAGPATPATCRAPAPSEQLRRELSAIRAYATFVSEQGDMPSDHRERFLTQIVGACDRALVKLN
ncbi:MAG: hypothetical protein AAF495_08340 [Pseudomonadota bacterium]